MAVIHLQVLQQSQNYGNEGSDTVLKQIAGVGS